MDSQIFYYGHVELVSPSGGTKATRSLSEPTLSFGRAETCDIQIALEQCSRTHLTIVVQDEEPFTVRLSPLDLPPFPCVGGGVSQHFGSWNGC